MKTMTCNQLGGACDLEFTAESFEEIAEMSKKHGMEMFAQNDTPHLDAMHKMKNLVQNRVLLTNGLLIERPILMPYLIPNSSNDFKTKKTNSLHRNEFRWIHCRKK